MIDFLCQFETLLPKMLKLLKIPGFLIKIPGFSRLFLPKLSNSFQVKWQPCLNIGHTFYSLELFEINKKQHNF